MKKRQRRGVQARKRLVSLVVYVPDSHREAVKEAMFRAGAGRIGHYDSCCWETKGEGQYRPLPGSDPHLGQEGRLEKVAEWKIELVCEQKHLKDVVQAMKKAHPYETPAYAAFETLKY